MSGPHTADDLPALYAAALESGQAGELVEALLQVHNLSWRALADLSGISLGTLCRWGSGGKPDKRTLRDLKPLVKPDKRMSDRIAKASEAHPAGRMGRPRNRP